MKITLADRTEETAAIYYERAKHPIIRSFLPQKAQSLSEALTAFQKAQLPNAASFGRTIMADNEYVGDIWCYCINLCESPNAMLSYCVFEQTVWNYGIATEAVKMFLHEMKLRYDLHIIGAFTYSDNKASVRVLEKNGFLLLESFAEDGRESRYYQISLNEL